MIAAWHVRPEEENPMLGFRGASRYISEAFRDCFELECRALKRVRNEMGLTNEEGSRFAPAMISSGVYAGVFDLEYGLSRADKNGVTIGQALQQIGYAGPHPVGGQAVHAAFELHIEQGPILEAQGITIGVVTGAQGQRWKCTKAWCTSAPRSMARTSRSARSCPKGRPRQR